MKIILKIKITFYLRDTVSDSEYGVFSIHILSRVSPTGVLQSDMVAKLKIDEF